MPALERRGARRGSPRLLRGPQATQCRQLDGPVPMPGLRAALGQCPAQQAVRRRARHKARSRGWPATGQRSCRWRMRMHTCGGRRSTLAGQPWVIASHGPGTASHGHSCRRQALATSWQRPPPTLVLRVAALSTPTHPALAACAHLDWLLPGAAPCRQTSPTAGRQPRPLPVCTRGTGLGRAHVAAGSSASLSGGRAHCLASKDTTGVPQDMSQAICEHSARGY